MFAITKVILAAALVFGAASAALANDQDSSASATQAQRDWREWQQGVFQSHMSNQRSANTAYGYVPSPGHQLKSGKRHDRL